ncbi:MAG: carboxypeptidase regulatory-like domain-containing protein, partial [Methanobrevibacter sp.]|nr:carboxypeptidase regulatory-like domain-containing protein [Methanobrevibacter sp.]
TVFKVVVPTTIPSEDISRGYNSPYDYVAVFTDECGNILNNTNVSMIVDGKIYNLTTDENGVAYLNDTLAIGKHNILLVNPVSGENRTHIVTIVERLQENKDIVMDFCDGTYYSVRAYGDDAKPIAGVTVTITVNGVSYDVLTNADGYAVLKIRLNPKTYTITAEWKDYKINKIVVRQTLKAKSVKVKKSANKFKYSASLKWSNGKPIVGEIITFKFKGKTYKAKTNKKGIAKITFNKKVLSKLKAGKKYKINVTYNHVDSGYTSVNSIVKKIKVKN